MTLSSTQRPGSLSISLDFEMYWGLRDLHWAECYRPNLLGEERAVEKTLELFREYGIHATWAVVGFLFYSTREELLAAFPTRTPRYRNTDLDPYAYILDKTDLERSIHFAPHLIELIKNTAGQELATHTFSHYYCLEEGQVLEDFEHDLRSAVAIANCHGAEVRSLVFPRNQYNEYYLRALQKVGIRCFRGNPKSRLYAGVRESDQRQLFRALRLIDSYINLTGHHTFVPCTFDGTGPVNIPGSRFLRPYSKHLRYLEFLRIRRIKQSMDHAARRGETFHLWWHPHNFGVETERNLTALAAILDHYRSLQAEFGMKSMSMGELAEDSTAMAHGRHASR